MTSVVKYTESGNPYIDGLLKEGEYKWDTLSLTYSFPTSISYYGGPSYSALGEGSRSFSAFNEKQQSVVLEILNKFSSISNLKFTLISESDSQHADIRFGLSLPGYGAGWAYRPAMNNKAGDVWFPDNEYPKDPKKWNYYGTYIHEIGHALGLLHPSEGGMPAGYSDGPYTLMTSGGTYYRTPMILDVAAIQHLYGANFTTNSNNTTYSWSQTTGEAFINEIGQGAFFEKAPMQTIWDGGGIDTYDFSNYTTNLNINLNPGEWTTTIQSGTSLKGIIANALLYNEDPRSLIENAIGGSGNDTIIGNQTSNILTGGKGNDILDGKGGADLLTGGEGNDIYYIDNINDTIVEHLNEGHDSIYSSISNYNGLKYDNIEDFFLLEEGKNIDFLGNKLNNRITGNSSNNRLSGYDGDDILVGGKGNDTLTGGFGNDTFIFTRGDGQDTVTLGEFRTSDIDTLQFEGDIGIDQLWFTRQQSYDLSIGIIGTSDKVSITNFFQSKSDILDKVSANGKILNYDKVDQLVNAMAEFSPPALGQTTLPSNYQQTLAPTITAAWS